MTTRPFKAAPIKNARDWQALPLLEIPEQETATATGIKHYVIRAGFLLVPQSECRDAGLGELPTEQGGTKVVLPTATVRGHDGEEILHRLPPQLGGWAFDLCGLVHSAGVRFLPAEVEFRHHAGRYSAGTARGEEYAIRSWAKPQH